MEIKIKACNPANYGGTRTRTEYIVVHYTSNHGDTANNNAVYFNREALSRPASAHYFVDENEIWNSVPENCIAYHCGATSYRHPLCRNANSIGVEICMNAKDGSIRQGSIGRAVELVKWLMNLYKVPLENVLRHHDVTGKLCPAPMVDDPTLWENFKQRLQEEEMKVYKYVDEMPEWARDAATKAIKKGIVAMDAQGAVSIYEVNLQTLVWMDRAGMLDGE